MVLMGIISGMAAESGILAGNGFGITGAGYVSAAKQTGKGNLAESSLDNESECFFCGTDGRSIMQYLRGRDDLGIICLNSGNILEMQVCGTASQELPIFSSMGTGEHGCRFSRSNYAGRGISEVSISLGEKSYLMIESLRERLCQDCLDKVAEMIERCGSQEGEEEPYDLCMVDFQTQELYPLQRSRTSYLVRDYYIHIDYSDSQIDMTAVFVPGEDEQE